jgi:hypothetical protein
VVPDPDFVSILFEFLGKLGYRVAVCGVMGQTPEDQDRLRLLRRGGNLFFDHGGRHNDGSGNGAPNQPFLDFAEHSLLSEIGRKRRTST